MFTHSSFKSQNGKNEYFISVSPEKNPSFSRCLEQMHESYLSGLKKLSLSEDTQIFCRFYLSDIANQKEELIRSKIFTLAQKGAYSIIQQCPLNGSNISMLSYHIEGGGRKEKIASKDAWTNELKATGDSYSFYYSGNYYSATSSGSFDQTNDIFSSYDSFLKENGMTLLHNTVRTWVYVRDIDNNYDGMVKSRKSYFEKNGLTKDTRFIASTGIEAKLKEVSTLVSMDAISIAGLQPAQIVRMEAREHLNPTHEYGVTFERGTKIVFGDRAHLYISGTASIDKKGEVVHVGDVGAQTKRVIENVEALLKPHGARLEDMKYLIVYARNLTQADDIMSMLKKEGLGNIPLILAEGSVCRPAWLVEIEGIAIVPARTDWPAFY